MGNSEFRHFEGGNEKAELAWKQIQHYQSECDDENAYEKNKYARQMGKCSIFEKHCRHRSNVQKR